MVLNNPGKGHDSIILEKSLKIEILYGD